MEGSYFDISTYAAFDSAAGFTITIPYDPSKVTDPTKLKLYYWEGSPGSWVDVTTSVDVSGHTVSGHAHSFSDYAIMEPIDTHTLTYTAGAGGTISGISPQTVNYGTSGAPVTATPDTGYHFVSWSDDVATATRTDSNVTGNVTVTATFAIDTHTLTYTAGAGGTISGISPQTVNYGTSGAPVTATPDTGYHFVSWSDDVAVVTTPWDGCVYETSVPTP